MSHETVRVGFIGAGAICRTKHLPGLAAIDGAEVVAVCNRSEESARKVAADFNIPHIESDWKKLIAREDLDAVFIGTWPYMHKQLSIAALEAGKHCFCQARMAMNLDESKQMLAAARGHPHLVNMICPCPWPLEHHVRDMIHSGQLGRITSVELIAAGGGNLDRSTVHWRERTEYSGNQILAMGILAETLNAMVGPYEELSAQTATPIETKTDESRAPVRIGVPQVVTISGSLENGALAIEHHSGVAVDSTSREMRLTIRGLEGTLRYDLAGCLEFGRPDEPLGQVEVPEERRTAWSVETDFIGAVRAARAGKPAEARSARPDFTEGVLYMRKVEAVHRSASTGRAVKPAEL